MQETDRYDVVVVGGLERRAGLGTLAKADADARRGRATQRSFFWSPWILLPQRDATERVAADGPRAVTALPERRSALCVGNWGQGRERRLRGEPGRRVEREGAEASARNRCRGRTTREARLQRTLGQGRLPLLVLPWLGTPRQAACGPKLQLVGGGASGPDPQLEPRPRTPHRRTRGSRRRRVADAPRPRRSGEGGADLAPRG